MVKDGASVLGLWTAWTGSHWVLDKSSVKAGILDSSCSVPRRYSVVCLRGSIGPFRVFVCCLLSHELSCSLLGLQEPSLACRLPPQS